MSKSDEHRSSKYILWIWSGHTKLGCTAMGSPLPKDLLLRWLWWDHNWSVWPIFVRLEWEWEIGSGWLSRGPTTLWTWSTTFSGWRKSSNWIKQRRGKIEDLRFWATNHHPIVRWGLDQALVTRGLLRTALCPLPPTSSLWDKLALSPLTSSPPQSSPLRCYQGNTRTCDRSTKKSTSQDCLWWHFHPDQVSWIDILTASYSRKHFAGRCWSTKEILPNSTLPQP